MPTEMTDTEKIAVGLFGWGDGRKVEPEWDGPNAKKVYEKNGQEVFAYTDGTCSGEFRPSSEWPDFTDDRLKWYWIRRVEDALAEKRLLTAYVTQLDALAAGTDEWRAQKETGAVSDSALQWREYHILRATVEQRLAAALRVIEEAPCQS